MDLIDRKQYLDWLISWKDSHVIKVVSGVRRSGKSKLFEIYVVICATMEPQMPRLYPSTLKIWSSSLLRRIEHSTTTFPPDSSPIR